MTTNNELTRKAIREYAEAHGLKVVYMHKQPPCWEARFEGTEPKLFRPIWKNGLPIVVTAEQAEPRIFRGIIAAHYDAINRKGVATYTLSPNHRIGFISRMEANWGYAVEKEGDYLTLYHTDDARTVIHSFKSEWEPFALRFDKLWDEAGEVVTKITS